MGENRTDYQHRRRRPVHPQYEQEQRRGSRTERLREQRYAEEEMRMQQEQRRRVGARMQRNHQSRWKCAADVKEGKSFFVYCWWRSLRGLLGQPNCTHL